MYKEVKLWDKVIIFLINFLKVGVEEKRFSEAAKKSLNTTLTKSSVKIEEK